MVTKNTLSILFWLWRSKINKKTGLIPVYARITINGDYDEISAGVKVLPGNWNNISKQAKGNSSDSAQVNDKILQMQADLKRHFIVLDAQYDLVTPAMLKNVYNGFPAIPPEVIAAQQGPTLTLLEAADKHISFVEEMVAKKKLSKGLLTIFKTTRTKIKEFLAFHYQKEDVKIGDISLDFAYNYYGYLTLHDPGDLDSNTAYKYIKKTKQFVTEAKKRGLVPVNPIGDFSCKYVQPERDCLEMYEIIEIYNKEFNDRLSEVRDLYLFCCFTGYAYCEVEALGPDHVFEGLDGKLWVSK